MVAQSFYISITLSIEHLFYEKVKNLGMENPLARLRTWGHMNERKNEQTNYMQLYIIDNHRYILSPLSPGLGLLGY